MLGKICENDSSSTQISFTKKLTCPDEMWSSVLDDPDSIALVGKKKSLPNNYCMHESPHFSPLNIDVCRKLTLKFSFLIFSCHLFLDSRFVSCCCVTSCVLFSTTQSFFFFLNPVLIRKSCCWITLSWQQKVTCSEHLCVFFACKSTTPTHHDEIKLPLYSFFISKTMPCWIGPFADCGRNVIST